MKTSQFMEHRWGHRVDLDVAADLLSPDGIATATVRNASVSGAMVETAMKPPLLSRVFLKPRASPGAWLDACVIRVDDKGIALEWLDPGRHPFSALLTARPSPHSD